MYPKELVEYEKELIEAKLIEFGKQKNEGLRKLTIDEIKFIDRKIKLVSVVLSKFGWMLTSLLAFISGRFLADKYTDYSLLQLLAGVVIVTLVIILPLNLLYLIVSRICLNRSTRFLTGDCEIQFFDEYYLLVYNDKKIFKSIKIKRGR